MFVLQPSSLVTCAELLNRNTNKMQLCNRIYCSRVYWRLNMFRAAHRSSSGALNSICSLWFICPCGDQPLPRRLPFPTQPWQRPHGHINQRLQIELELLMMSGVPLETCWAFNKLWNNKFYYKAASCWYLYWLTLRRLMSYIYGAPILDVSRSHTTTQHSR